MIARITLAAAALALAGCAQGPARVPDLLTLRTADGSPDEFAIVPNRPLEAPEDMAALPPPRPGLPNRADQTPVADAAVALGGRRDAAPAGVPVADGALVAAAARGGRAPDIRARTAAEDLAFRQRRFPRLLERLFGVTTYYDVYEGQSLDQSREIERWRARGVRTPSAPPDPAR